MESPDIQAKYQKLASEYSKLRAQNQVLKKAVIEEQGKSLQSSDVLKEKDQCLRKSEQENESLSFRNQQLTKRLTLLQEDLDILQNKGKKSKSKQNSVSADGFMDGNNVFTEELQAKINENARLHAQLADTEKLYSKQLAEMEGKLEDVQKDLQKKQDSQQITQIAASERVDQLEGELVAKELKHQSLDKELSAAKEELIRLQELLQSATAKQKQAQEATSQNEVSAASFSKQISTNDTSSLVVEHNQNKTSQLSQAYPTAGSNLVNRSTSDLHINCSQFPRDVRVSSKTLVQTFDGLIQEMCDAFTKFIQGFISRVKLHPSNSNIKQKLLEQLNSGLGVWNSLSASYHQVAVSATSETFVALETLSGLPSVSQNVTYCSASLRKLLPAMIHWSSEESGSSSEDLGNRAMNTWGSAFSRITATWGSLTPYVATLATQNLPNSNLPPSAQGRVFTMLADRLHQLHSALKEASQVWTAKLEREHQDSKISSELRVTSQQVADGLQALDSVVAKMSGVFREQVLTSWSRGGSTPSTPSSPYPALPQSGSSTSLTQDAISSVVHSEALTITSVETSESQAVLEKQLSLASSKLSQLEAEREHWRLEHQLLHCKHQKEEKRVRVLEAQLNRINQKGSTDEGDSKGSLNNSNDGRDRTTSSTSVTSLIGEVSGSSLAASEEREKEIRNHFTNRCSHLYMQLTQTTGTASLYQNECESLMRRLVICEEKRVGAEQEVDNQRANVNQLKETLQTTSRNYEEQVSTMSEHLADLNEKIATQTDHIEQLKFEIKNRKAKK